MLEISNNLPLGRCTPTLWPQANWGSFPLPRRNEYKIILQFNFQGDLVTFPLLRPAVGHRENFAPASNFIGQPGHRNTLECGALRIPSSVFDKRKLTIFSGLSMEFRNIVRVLTDF